MFGDLGKKFGESEAILEGSPAPTPPKISLAVLTAIAVTTSITLWIVLWVIAIVYFRPNQAIFAQLGADLPAVSEWAAQWQAWMWLKLGAIWSGLFYYGAQQKWFSHRKARLLLISTILLTWVYGAVVFLAIVIPSFAVMEEIG